MDLSKDLSQYNCQNWTRDNGLPANGVNSITQTKDGFLWIGTQMGLVRYDGLEFKQFKLPNALEFRNQVISSLFPSARGGLWFGIREGSFGYYSPDTGFFSPAESWVTPTMNVTAIREASDGALWLGAGTGTARWSKDNPGQTEFHSALPYTLSLYEDSRHRIWVGTAEHGLYFWENGKLNPFPDGALLKDSVSTLVVDSLGQIWVGTQVGLRCYDAEFRPKEIDFSRAEVKTLLLDRQGALWIGTTGEGLSRYYNGTFTSLRKSGGLADDTVTSLFEDAEGSLWVGMRNGLSQLADVKLPLFSTGQGLASSVSHGICPAQNGGFWLATSSGITAFDGQRARNFGVESGLSSAYTKQILEARDGDVYLFNGLKRIEVFSQNKVVASYAHSNWPTSLAQDSHGVIVSVAGSLFRVNRSGCTPITFNGPAPPLFWIRHMLGCRDGSVLIASVNGIFRLQDNAWERWPNNNSFVNQDVLWLHEDAEGVCWAGLRTAIARIKQGQVRLVTRDNGLFDIAIYSFISDNNGSYWVNSTRGIFRVSRKDLNDFCDGKSLQVQCQPFDGLEAVKAVDTTEVEFGAACKTLDGRIWIPSPQGVIMINPANLVQNTVPPPVQIEQIRANSRELRRGNSLSIEPGKGELEIQYAGLSFIAPKKVHYRYRLEGYEPNWINAGNRRSAFYTNLKPGNYRFHVQACNADGVWNNDGDSVTIEFPPRYYQTAWFQGLCALGAIALMAGLYVWRIDHVRRREKNLQKQNQLLETKVQERTRELLEVSRQAGMAEVATSVLHNVGNVLNSINVSATLVQDRIRKPGADGLNRIVDLLRTHEKNLPEFFAESGKPRQLIGYLEALLQHANIEKSEQMQEIKSLVQNVEHIKEIVAMQQTYARVSGVTEIVNVIDLIEDALRIHALGCERHGITLSREFSPVPPLTIDRHKALQILVNLLRNAMQACEATGLGNRKIVVRLEPNGLNLIRIVISDNGVGIPPENLTRIFSHGFTTRKHGHGFGLHSGALSAQEMGGSLSAKSDGAGKGATFTLVLPIEPNSKSTEPR